MDCLLGTDTIYNLKHDKQGIEFGEVSKNRQNAKRALVVQSFLTCVERFEIICQPCTRVRLQEFHTNSNLRLR